MKKYQQLAEIFLKYTPDTNKVATKHMLDNSQFEKMTEREIDPVVRYIESLQVHREYLEFFQIGVFRDQRSKIEKVAKYVGLAIRQIDPALTPSSLEGT
jgi:hypothetical protein